MSIQSEIDRIRNNVANTYSALEGAGAAMPEVQNSDNLAATAQTIPTGGTGAAGNAVLYDPQTLTEEQQAQARANIGAQAALTFDTTPKSGSTNPVTSGGLYSKFATQDSNISSAQMAASLAMPGSLKWDGAIGDKESIVLGQEDVFNITLVHVSDEYPKTPGTSAILSRTEMFSIEASLVEPYVQEDGFIVLGNSVYIAPQDNYTIPDSEGITLPKKGVYFMAYHAAPMGYDFSGMYTSGLYIAGYPFAESGGGDASKYFESKTKTERVELGDTLTWDGNTEGRENLLATVGLPLYKVSDTVFTGADLLNGFTIYNSEGQELSFTSDEVAGEAGVGVNIGSAVFSITAVGAAQIGVSAGTYFATDDELYIASLTIPNFTFTSESKVKTEIIKTEHLPEALRFGEIEVESEGGDTLTWDGNTDGLVSLSGVFYKVSDATPTIDDLANGCIVGAIGETIDCPPDWVSVQDGVITIADPNTIPIPLVLIVFDEAVAEENGVTTGTYLPSLDLTSIGGPGMFTVNQFTIPGYTGFASTTTEVVKIDPKYLPDNAPVLHLTSPSGKKFAITVDDNGNLTTTEVTE